MIWNPKLVPDGLTSWKDVFENPALAGAATIEDFPYYSIAIGVLALGYPDPYNLTTDDLARVRDYFIEHKDQFRTFYEGDSQFLNLYKSGEIAGGMGFNDYPVTLAPDWSEGGLPAGAGRDADLDLRVGDPEERGERRRGVRADQ